MNLNVVLPSIGSSLMLLLLLLVLTQSCTGDDPKWQKSTELKICDSTERKEDGSFKVHSAFRMGTFAAFEGVLTVNKLSVQTVLRSYYTRKKEADQLHSNDYVFYDTRVFDKMVDNYQDRHKIDFAFDFDTTFAKKADATFSEKAGDKKNQVNSNLQYFVKKGGNTTIALELQYNKPSDNEWPEFNFLNEKVVYDSKTDADDSKFLSLKLLYLHFPTDPSPGVQITAILFYGWEEEVTKNIQYFAIVYTVEKFNNEDNFFRHFMKSKVVTYQFDVLEWTYDTLNTQCQRIDNRVVAAVLLYTQTPSSPKLDDDDTEDTVKNKYVVKYMEIYGEQYKQISIEFDDITTGKFKLTGDGPDDYKPVYNFVINCKSHPTTLKAPRIGCDDYKNDDLDQMASGVLSDDDSHSSFWLLFGIIAAIVFILVLIAFGVYLIVWSDKPNANKASVENADQKANNQPIQPKLNN